eukprot:1141679-Pelagomonas_calceolata.AAC.4
MYVGVPHPRIDTVGIAHVSVAHEVIGEDLTLMLLKFLRPLAHPIRNTFCHTEINRAMITVLVLVAVGCMDCSARAGSSAVQGLCWEQVLCSERRGAVLMLGAVFMLGAAGCSAELTLGAAGMGHPRSSCQGRLPSTCWTESALSFAFFCSPSASSGATQEQSAHQLCSQGHSRSILIKAHCVGEGGSARLLPSKHWHS